TEKTLKSVGASHKPRPPIEPMNQNPPRRVPGTVPRCFRRKLVPLINTQLQLGGQRAQGTCNRFSGFPTLADSMHLPRGWCLATGETVETVGSRSSPAATQLKLGVNETAFGRAASSSTEDIEEPLQLT